MKQTFQPADTRADLISGHTAWFPLPLTPFEQYMMLDAQCGNPMVFSVELCLEGEVNRGLFEESLRLAISRHPLCGAIVSVVNRKLHWTLAAAVQPVLLWLAAGEVPPPEWSEPIDLRRKCGTKVLVIQGNGRAQITLQFHHACCDGLGASQFINDLMALYSVGNSPPENGSASPQMTSLRPQHRSRPRGDYAGPRWIKEWIVEFYRFFMRRPQALRIPGEAARRDAAFDGAQARHHFEIVETQQLRRAARQASVTVNDLLVRDLFSTLADWNSSSTSRGNNWYRISVPISLRTRDNYHSPAMNVMTYAFLDRRHVECQSRSQLLVSVDSELRTKQRSRHGTLFLDALANLSMLPGALALLLKLPLCLSTAVLSNMGDPRVRLKYGFPRSGREIVFGNLVLKSVCGLPPLRARTHCSVGVNTYAGRLMIGVRLAPEYFHRTDAEAFLQMYVGHIRESLATGTD